MVPTVVQGLQYKGKRKLGLCFFYCAVCSLIFLGFGRLAWVEGQTRLSIVRIAATIWYVGNTSWCGSIASLHLCYNFLISAPI